MQPPPSLDVPPPTTRPPLLIVVSFHLPPPLQQCRPFGSTTGTSTTPLSFLPSARQTCMKGRGAQQQGCHNPLRRRLLFVTGCAGETGTSQSLSWPPSSFAIASLEVITSIATRQSIMLSRSVARLPTPLTALLHDAPAAAQERCPMEGRGPRRSPPPRSASHSSLVEGTRQGRRPVRPRPAGGARRPHVCAAPRGGAAALRITYGSLKEGEGDKEFDGVTKNSMRVMRRV